MVSPCAESGRRCPISILHKYDYNTNAWLKYNSPSAFQFYISTIIMWGAPTAQAGTSTFQFYISTIIIWLRSASRRLPRISILHKYDYNDWLVAERQLDFSISILHKYDYNQLAMMREAGINPLFQFYISTIIIGMLCSQGRWSTQISILHKYDYNLFIPHSAPAGTNFNST